jgi:glycosyltransferase involved in cell wall biosynthesis
MNRTADDPVLTRKVADQPAGGPPLVSVAMLTYNHERYIAQAIESVLSQEADFQVELIVGEDCSTDGTRRIVREYAEKYSNVIRPLLAEHNLGMQENCNRVLAACRGKYVALLEGDDYWVLPDKLSTQVRILEANPRYSMCGSTTQIVASGRSGGDRVVGMIRPRRQKESYGLEDVLLDRPMHLSTVLFRSGFVDTPDWLSQVINRDFCKFAILAEKGPAVFLDAITSRYRMNSGGIWSGKSVSDQVRCKMEALDLLDAHFERKYHSVIVKARVVNALEASASLAIKGRWAEARAVYREFGKSDFRAMPLAVKLWSVGALADKLWVKLTQTIAFRLGLKGRPRYDRTETRPA